MREVDLTALSEAFNIPLGLDSDSDESDQEYAPHREGEIYNYLAAYYIYRPRICKWLLMVAKIFAYVSIVKWGIL